MIAGTSLVVRNRRRNRQPVLNCSHTHTQLVLTPLHACLRHAQACARQSRACRCPLSVHNPPVSRSFKDKGHQPSSFVILTRPGWSVSKTKFDAQLSLDATQPQFLMLLEQYMIVKIGENVNKTGGIWGYLGLFRAKSLAAGYAAPGRRRGPKTQENHKSRDEGAATARKRRKAHESHE